MPVAGSPAKSSAMIAAAPRRKANGVADIRPMRTGISRSTRPWFVASTRSTGSVRSAGAFHRPRDDRGARCRSRRPSAYRSARGVDGRRRDANAPASVASRTRCAGGPVMSPFQLHGTQYRRNARFPPVPSSRIATHRAAAGARSSMTITRRTCTATTNATSTPDEIAVASTA